jgi:hypothetical protein
MAETDRCASAMLAETAYGASARWEPIFGALLPLKFSNRASRERNLRIGDERVSECGIGRQFARVRRCCHLTMAQQHHLHLIKKRKEQLRRR